MHAPANRFIQVSEALMFFPYGTDAPIYHRPLGTVTVIALNCLMFGLTGMGEVAGNPSSSFRWLILEFDGINPLQWVTSAFMHASVMHLIGNMIFLWCFGLIVEGKIGWKKFAILYTGLCLADGAIGQIPMFLMHGDSVGGALGASGVIFALMAIAMCWAPENEVSCLFVFWYGIRFIYTRTIDVPIFAFAAIYLLLQLLPLFISGFQMSTPLLHLLGMSVGFPFAIYMLKHNLVDCEGWDLLSRWNRVPRNPMVILGKVSSYRFRREKNPSLGGIYAARRKETENDALSQILANPSAFSAPTIQSTNPPQTRFPSRKTRSSRRRT